MTAPENQNLMANNGGCNCEAGNCQCGHHQTCDCAPGECKCDHNHGADGHTPADKADNAANAEKAGCNCGCGH